ncbi:hypothetical protein FRC00_010107 [Tulasnella sp. 408]|nr:hypothetical protein FRC00_010107 [Tulasnella sp. 408]
MTDSLNTRTKVAEFKTLYKTTTPDLPKIIPRSTTNTRWYALPVMPELETFGPVELVHDPNLPDGLINGLDQFADTLQESQLDNAHLTMAKQCLGVATIYNIIPDHAWNVEGEAIAIFEHKSPCVAEHHFPDIIDLAKKRTKLDLSKSSSNATSILSKLIVTSIYKKLDYCAVHSGVSFIFIHIVQDSETQCYQARISDEIPLTSSTTPIIAVVLALILHSRKDNQALEYRSSEVRSDTIGKASSEEDATGLHGGASALEPYTSPDRQAGSYPCADIQIQMENLLTVSEYWEARELSEVELAALLNTVGQVSALLLYPLTHSLF